jgi:hypothetical protein
MKKLVIVVAISLLMAGSQAISQEKSVCFSHDLEFFSTYFGGAGAEHSSSPKIDSRGNIFVAGYTTEAISGLPGGGYDTTYNGGGDAFVAKFSPDLSRLMSFTYIGSSGEERAYDLVIDSNDQVVITGTTASAAFPVTAGAYDQQHGGGRDTFVARFSSDLGNLIAATFIGGPGDDWYCNVALDKDEKILVALSSDSMSYDIPGGYRSSSPASMSLVVILLDKDLKVVERGAVIGGSSNEYCFEMAINSLGDVYLVGDTSSTGFPTTENAYNSNSRGGIDCFLIALSPDLNNLRYSTLTGGSSNDMGAYLVIDSADNVFIAGESGSTDLPATPGAYSVSNSGRYDLHLAKFDRTLGNLLACSYFGGSEVENCHGIAVDRHDNIYFAGYTGSANLPMTEGCYDSSYNGGEMDLYVVKLNNDLSQLLASTYLGGSGTDYYGGICLDLNDNPVVQGRVSSEDYPVTPDSFQSSYGGGEYDLVLSKIPRDLSLVNVSESVDLGLEQVRVNRKKLVPGSTYKFKAAVRNLSQDLESYRCKASFYISSKDRLTKKARFIGGAEVKSVSPGKKKKAKLNATLPGDYKYKKRNWLIVVLDEENLNYDFVTDNNIYALELEIER